MPSKKRKKPADPAALKRQLDEATARIRELSNVLASASAPLRARMDQARARLAEVVAFVRAVEEEGITALPTKDDSGELEKMILDAVEIARTLLSRVGGNFTEDEWLTLRSELLAMIHEVDDERAAMEEFFRENPRRGKRKKGPG